MANHKGLLDAWHIGNNLPFKIWRKIIPTKAYVTNKFTHQTARKINRLKLIDLVYSVYGAILVPSGNNFQTKIKPLVQALRQRESILIFPEGRIVTEDKIGEFKRGVVEVYRQTKCPILPVSIKMTRDKFKRQILRLNYGPIIHIPDELLTDPSAEESYRRAGEYLREIILCLYQKEEP